MGGKDITADCYSNGVISIPAVTGDVIVTARTVLKYNTPVSYRWETISNALQSVNDGGAIYNHATLIGGSCSGGVFTDGQHSLDNAVALFHDRPWVIEWKATGAWSSGALILAGAAESKVEGSTYIYKTTGSNLLAIGYSDGSKYHNYGLNLADYNIDGTATHIYRLVNEISEDGSNMVYLHVDGNKIGAMNNYYDGGTNMNTVSDKLNGMDLVFTNIGTSGHPLNNATISYIQVWEGGIPVETTLNDYRWEPANGTMTSVTVNGNIDNPAKLQSGSVGSDGKLSSSYFELDQAVKLLHDKPWSIQWKSTGTWKDSTNGAMLFAASNVTNAPFGAYIYRRGGSDLIAFGERNGSSHNNYGISLADHGIDGSAEHVYRLTNRINADGSNMVYLYVDGVELGAMNNYYVGGNAQGTTSNWISGKDFTFNYMGNAQFPISNCYLSYVQVWEDGLIPNDYRWEMSNDMLTSVTNDSFVQNDLTMVSGSISGGKLSGTQMKLEENLILRHDRNWSLEWKSSGSWKEASNGALLLSSNPTSTSDGTVYLYRRNDSNFIALGVRSNNKHLNYGVMLSDHGIDGSAEHVYRLTNRVNADGSNMVYLYVDDVELGAMNNYYIGGTAQGTTSDWVSGQDFVISYMGTTDFPIGNCCIDYIQVREMDTSFHEYRWETDTDRLNSISVGYTENNVTAMTGSITGGTYTDSMFHLEKTVVLRHNQPWFMEWQSEGSWNNSRGGALLLSSEDAANIAGNKYLFRRKDSTLIALGTNNGSKYENYGVRLSDYGIDASEAHVYRMENRVYANGSNMVYLYVDGVEISAMNHYFLGDAPQGTTSDWLSGKDFSFNYMGSTDYLIGNCTIGYIHIDEDGCMDNFRWENRSDVFTDVTIGGNSENEATMLSGSITNGLFSGTSFSLAQPVTLMHNQPWTLEWKSSGNWKDTQKGAMLLSSTAMHTTEGMSYLYRRSDSDFIAFGMLTNGAHMNYGIRLSDYGIDGTAVHTYLLSNRINSDGSNMVYLFVDGVEVGPLNNTYKSSTDQYTKSNWISGKDFTFAYLGNVSFYIGNCQLDYLQVREGGGSATVKFVNWDGSVVSEKQYLYGQSISAPDLIPTRNADASAVYTFTGWDKEIEICAGDAVYTAVFKAEYIDYTVEFRDYDGKVLSSAVYHYGDAVTVPADPERPADSAYTYTFAGWDKEVVAVDGNVTYSATYEATAIRNPQITLSHPTLNFKSEIMYNVYYTASDVEDAVEMGLLIFDQRLTDGTVEDAKEIVPGYTVSGGMYMVHTNGIPAKNLGDTVFFKVYARLVDGTYVYSSMVGYHAIAYANSILNNASSSAQSKALVVAMLNYGTQAQLYFGYKTDSLMNAGLTADQQVLVDAYDEAMIDPVVSVASQKAGEFMLDRAAFASAYPRVSFEGAFAINYYFINALPVDGDMTLYYWDSATCAMVDVLTKENASGSITMSYDGNRYYAKVSGIAARQIDESVYVTGCYTSGGISYSTGIIAYSLGAYCESIAADDNSDTQALGAATAVYGYYARNYFSTLG